MPHALPAYQLTLGSRTLLQTPAFELAPGRILAVTGPSGAGKSLWLRSLFGWSAPAQHAALSPRDGDFLLVQDPSQGLTPGLDLGGHFAELSPRPHREEIIALLARLGLEGNDLLTRPLHRFSGGERQRMMLALLLIQKPRLLVCDEPVASLDPASERRLWDLLIPLCSQGLSAIIVTHRLELIEDHADEVLLLEQGRAVFHGDRQQFFTQPATPLHEALLAQYRAAAVPMLAPATKNAPLLELRGLCHAYAGRRLFDNFQLSLRRAEALWLSGPSGSGKTTLAKIIAGLIPADRGELTLDGQPLAPLLHDRARSLRHRIQYLFQHGTEALNPARTVAAQLAEALPQLATREAHLRHLRLDQIDLTSPPAAFSMGELQRLNLMRALARTPDLLIADELLASMDLGVRVAVLDLLERYRRDHGTSVVLISHEPPKTAGHPYAHLALALAEPQ